MCTACRGAPGDVVGYSFEVKHEERLNVEVQYNTARMHDVEIKLGFTPPVELSAHFTHEHGGHRLVKIFKAEYQAGDAEFDDAIYIRDKYREATKRLLARGGAREAILALVRDHGEVHIDPGKIRFRTHDRDDTDVEGYAIAVLALARHVIASASEPS